MLERDRVRVRGKRSVKVCAGVDEFESRAVLENSDGLDDTDAVIVCVSLTDCDKA